MQEQTVPIQGMHCHSCELLLEDALGAVRGVTQVRVNAQKGYAVITCDKVTPSQEEIATAVAGAGYKVGASAVLPWVTKNPADWRYIVFGIVTLVVLYYVVRGTGLFTFSLADDEVTFGFALVLGLVAGVSTCMALVGGLILGASARHAALHPEATRWQQFRPHLFFNAGRVVGYAVFGGLLGLLGGALQISSGVLTVLTLVVGVIMVLLGIKLTNLSPRIAATSFTLPPSIARFLGISTHQKEYSHRAALMTGALTFFLPCGFTQAMQLYAISTGSFASGAIALGAFALGTSPALLGIGGLSSVMKGTAARVFYGVVGVLVIAFGIFNMKNALAVLPLRVSSPGSVVESGIENVAGTQTLTMTQTASGYVPQTLRVKAGLPVRWVITSESSFTCASSLIVPSLGIQKNLKKGENIITFTPTAPGTIPFSCSMGMYRGTIIVE